jgi:apolipoprotein N-acyltransferase
MHYDVRLQWALAMMAGFFNGAGFVFAGEFVLFANVPLLLALTCSPTVTEAMKLGALVGFLGGIHIYGVINYGWWIFWAFSLYTGSQLLIYALAFYLLWQRKKQRYYRYYELFVPAMAWVVTEWIRTAGPIALPASYVGCLADRTWFKPWLSWAYYCGGLGVSFLVALCQSILFQLIACYFSPTQWKESFKPIVLGILIIGLTGFFPLPAKLKNTEDQVATQVSLVQAGYSNLNYQAAVMDPLIAQEMVQQIAALLQRAYQSQAQLIFLAETVLRGPLRQEPSYQALIYPPKDQILIAGVLHHEKGIFHNLALAIQGQKELAHYAKVRPVPGTENNIEPGKEWKAIDTPLGKIAILICFESIYPQAGREVNQEDSVMMAVLSNDAGFGYSPISRYMTNRSIERAVETGKWLVRVGQSGVSAIINPHGEIIAQIPLFQSEILN